MHCFIFSLITLLLYVFVKTSKALHSLQQNWYNDGNRYIKWINNNLEKVFINFDMLFLIVILLGFFVSSNLQYILFSIFYLVCIFILTRKKEQVKLPLKYTSRVKRLLVTIYIIYLIPLIFICLNYNECYLNIYYIIYGILAYSNYYVVYLANIINKPIEKCVFYYYKNKATKKLNSMNNMNIIGITGSYGKTSSKNILSDILNIKYNALPAPKNFNTTYVVLKFLGAGKALYFIFKISDNIFLLLVFP